MGLAAVIIGLITCAFGSIIYRIVIVLALNANDIGLQASDLNLITAVIVALTMILSKLKRY